MKLQILQKTNLTYGKEISFLYLLNLVNYKKFKSIKKRLLIPNYIFFRKFLTSIKYNLLSKLNRKYVQPNVRHNLFIPGFLLHKRMFFKHTFLLNYLESKKLDYYWCGGLAYNISNKDKLFFKIKHIQNKFGNNVFIALEDDLGEEFKHVNTHLKQLSPQFEKQFNMFIHYNIFLLNLLELYKIFIYINIYITLFN
jgi:hypothetical protein